MESFSWLFDHHHTVFSSSSSNLTRRVEIHSPNFNLPLNRGSSGRRRRKKNRGKWNRNLIFTSILTFLALQRISLVSFFFLVRNGFFFFYTQTDALPRCEERRRSQHPFFLHLPVVGFNIVVTHKKKKKKISLKFFSFLQGKAISHIILILACSTG